MEATATSCPRHSRDREECCPEPAPVRSRDRASGRQQHKQRNHMPHRLSPAIMAAPRLLISGAVLAALVALAMWGNGASPALAATGCVVSIGVTQTATTVTGTGANDTIDCGASTSAKTVNGNGGNDTITGSAFVDTLNGNDGNDTMTGGIAVDTLNGGNGDDTLTGNVGNDKLNGGNGDDTLTGSEDNDILKGDANNDTLNGGTGIDNLDGGLGADIINGDANNDTLTGPPTDSALDQLNGGAHDALPGDTCTAGGAVPFTDVLTACNP
ncbi:MAG TPA: calcium-binding protein [Solirubrobacteraceae bacterium]|nr:calcium-binding protein [Solirubrobacteraceae bacterium]